MLPIKFIDGNMIKNNLEEWWAYYSIEPYNYSFTNDEEKLGYFNRLNRLFNQVSTSDIHVLVPTIEEKVSTIFEQSKKFAIGDLKEVACEMLDDTEYIMTSDDYTQPPALKMEEPFFTGDTQLSTRFYIGFRLVPSKEDGGVKGSFKELGKYWADAFRSINHKAMGDFAKISKEDLKRYSDIEHLTYSRISNNLKIRRLTLDEIGYVVQHLNGSNDVPVNDYSYHLPVKESADGDSVCVKEYDILKLNNVEVEEHSNYLLHEYNGEPVYTTYLTISEFLEELSFPSSEIFYDQPVSLDFPVDTSIKVHVLENREALKKVRNQKARINDIDNHAWETGNSTGGDVDIAKDDIEALETTVKINRESMYTVSYIVRITASDRKELRRRVNAVTDFYSGYGINMVCSSGDMMILHEECMPSASLKNQLVHYFRSNFLACLGLGAGTIMGYPTGIPIGHTTYSQRLFCVRPWASAQGLVGTVSNSASMGFIGKMGGGKTAANNFYSVYSTNFGARGIIIDPKAERGHWKEAFPQIADEITISKLTKDEENRGILDPYLLFENVDEAEEISLEILTYLLGVSIHDEEKYPALESALKRVSSRSVKGLLLVIVELVQDPHEETALISRVLARQLESFSRMGLSKLFMSDGLQRNTINLDRRLNIIQIDDLMLPEKGKSFEQYTSKETLSVAVMMVVSTFCLKFIRTFPNDFKFVNMDEAWSILNVAQGAELTNRLDREGRAMNAGVWYSTQNTSDLPDGKIKNSLGQVFIFRMDDIGEIKLALELLGVNSDDENNIETIKELANGECIMKDLYGRVNKIKFDIVLPQMFSAFDTRPKNMNEQGE